MPNIEVTTDETRKSPESKRGEAEDVAPKNAENTAADKEDVDVEMLEDERKANAGENVDGEEKAMDVDEAASPPGGDDRNALVVDPIYGIVTPDPAPRTIYPNPFRLPLNHPEAAYVTTTVRFVERVATEKEKELPKLKLEDMRDDVEDMVNAWAGFDRAMGYPGPKVSHSLSWRWWR